MSVPRPTRAEREVLAFCRELGIEDAEVRHGSKHRKLFIGDRLAHVLCHGTKADAGDKGLRFVKNSIRRIAQERNHEHLPPRSDG